MTKEILQTDIIMNPIGYVESSIKDYAKMPLGGGQAIIHVSPEYQDALLQIGEYSHLWILSWFHLSDRSLLKVRPSKVNPDSPEHGVFALRSPVRPNPIALTLVKLDKVDGCNLHVNGLDAFDGTPVVDIKPYFGADVVFSPKDPYIPPRDRQMQAENFRRQAITHHGEECLGLEIGVKMALLAEDYFGHLQDPDLTIAIKGSPCLADVLQGLTRSRLANPARFFYSPTVQPSEVLWTKGDLSLKLKVPTSITAREVKQMATADIFKVELSCTPSQGG